VSAYLDRPASPTFELLPVAGAPVYGGSWGLSGSASYTRRRPGCRASRTIFAYFADTPCTQGRLRGDPWTGWPGPQLPEGTKWVGWPRFDGHASNEHPEPPEPGLVSRGSTGAPTCSTWPAGEVRKTYGGHRRCNWIGPSPHRRGCGWTRWRWPRCSNWTNSRGGGGWRAEHLRRRGGELGGRVVPARSLNATVYKATPAWSPFRRRAVPLVARGGPGRRKPGRAWGFAFQIGQQWAGCKTR